MVTKVGSVLLLGLVLAFFGGGGWYFAGRIHADALAVHTPEPAYDVTVRAVEPGRRGRPGTVTLDDGGDETALDELSVWGVRWPDGYGQVSGVARRDGDEVTRDFTVLDGRAPRPGTEVALDRAAYPDDGRVACGSFSHRVVLESDAGEFPAWLCADGTEPEGDTWAVLVHGKGGDPGEMFRMMHSTLRAGMPSLTIAYRNDADSPADASGQYGYGATEWPEVAAAVAYAQHRGARDVVLVGASMGGAIVTSYLAHAGTDDVAGVVLDSPMLSLGETVAYGAAHEPLPVLGHVPAPLTWAAQRITTLRYGLDWDAVDYLDAPGLDGVPTLVLHGDDDQTVPLSTSRELADSSRDVRLVVFPGAGHVASWNSDPVRYERVTTRFLRRL